MLFHHWALLKYFDKLCFTEIFIFKTSMRLLFWTQRAWPQCETSQNSQRKGRTDPIWTQGILLVHQRKTVTLTSPLYEEGNSPPQSPAEAGPPLLLGADLESLLSSPSDRKPKVEKNIAWCTEWPFSHPWSVLRLRRDRPDSCSVGGGWGLTGLWEAILPLWRAASVSLGHTWGLWMLRRCSQPMGGDRQMSLTGRDIHLGCPEDPPSESQGNQAPHTQLQQEHLHNWIRLRDPPASHRCHPRHPNPADPPSSPRYSHRGCLDLSIISYPMHCVGTFSPCLTWIHSSALTLSGLIGEAMTYESSHPSPLSTQPLELSMEHM